MTFKLINNTNFIMKQKFNSTVSNLKSTGIVPKSKENLRIEHKQSDKGNFTA